MIQNKKGHAISGRPIRKRLGRSKRGKELLVAVPHRGQSIFEPNFLTAETGREPLVAPVPPFVAISGAT